MQELIKLIFSFKRCDFCGYRKAICIFDNKKGKLYLCRYHYKLLKNKNYDPRKDYNEADYNTWLR